MDVEELAMLLQTMDFEPVSPEAFTKASQAVRSGLLNLEQDQQLMLYALFKQASEGDAPEAAPVSADPTAPYKHKAWASLKGFPRDGAGRVYMHLAGELVEMAKGAGSGAAGQQPAGWAVFSTLYRTSEEVWAKGEEVFAAMASDDLPALQALCTTEEVHSARYEGLSPLHYAADRGMTAHCELLLACPGGRAAVDARDGNNHTPLHCAVLSDQLAVGKLLLEHGADAQLACEGLDEDDVSDEFRLLLDQHIAMNGIDCNADTH